MLPKYIDGICIRTSMPQQNNSSPPLSAQVWLAPALTVSVSARASTAACNRVCPSTFYPQQDTFPFAMAQVWPEPALTSLALYHGAGTTNCPKWLLPQHVSMRYEIAQVCN
mmetsp:Transcript_43218/g.36246  ORF Transcript_43218/g.36246 Transcript_43218/m.36246 type:complete len:111 (+) Transcript_43218:94-426(+)